jgi:pimeloyl-ACP methyl ester carboxylesterase
MALTLHPETEATPKRLLGCRLARRPRSGFVYGGADQSIPTAPPAFIAARAGARQTVVVDGESHVVILSPPATVAQVIESAGTASEKQGGTQAGALMQIWNPMRLPRLQ